MSDAMIGKKLPEITLGISSGGNISLPKDILGQWTILYFYPEDDTPGCTKQACGYTSDLPRFESEDIRILGVSLDDMSSHMAFISKYSLGFPLLSDVKHELSQALGSYGEQEWKGEKYMGLSRDTFLIDPNGTIRNVWRKVNPVSTVEETLAYAKKIKSA